MTKLVNHVIDKRGYTLIGDSRGILTDSQLRQQVWDWAAQNKIKIEYQGTLDNRDLWYVKNDQDRSWFALRWS